MTGVGISGSFASVDVDSACVASVGSDDAEESCGSFERPADCASSFVAMSFLTNLTSSGPSAGASAGGLSSIEPYILTGLLGANACYAVCLLPVSARHALVVSKSRLCAVLVWTADSSR